MSIHSGGLVIKIAFPNHEAADPRYLQNLRAFVKKSKEAGPPFDVLGLDNDLATATPSQAHTPGERTIYFEEGCIGRGAFGWVSKAVRTCDGEYVAIKKFSAPANKRKWDRYDPEWLETIRREFAIMKDNPHVSALWCRPHPDYALTIEQPNVMQVIEFRETPEPLIVMRYYEHGNIVEAGVAYDQYVSAIGQVLDGLEHLHIKGIAHRDLKPENFLVEKHPLFKVVISDFGLSKVVTDTTLLRTFCGTLKYLAPEVFPGSNNGYGPSIDVWALGVIGFEWLYGVPDLPTIPMPRRKETEVKPDHWHHWIDAWADLLLSKLDDQDSDSTVEILLGMIETRPKRRWPADRCLQKGFENGLFRRRAADGLVVNARDPIEAASEAVEEDEQARTPTATLPPQM